MRPGILPEHEFKHKGNHYASLPWFGTKIAQKYAIKGSKFSGFRRDVKPHVLTFSTSGRQSRSQSPRAFWSAPKRHVGSGNEIVRATSGHNVLYMRNVVSKEMSRFRLPSSGRRLLLKVPNGPSGPFGWNLRVFVFSARAVVGHSSFQSSLGHGYGRFRRRLCFCFWQHFCHFCR